MDLTYFSDAFEECFTVMLIFGFCATVFLMISASSLLREHFFFFVFLFLFFWIGDFSGAKNLKSDSSELVISSKGNKAFGISGVFEGFWFASDSRKLRSFSMLRRLKGVLPDFKDQEECSFTRVIRVANLLSWRAELQLSSVFSEGHSAQLTLAQLRFFWRSAQLSFFWNSLSSAQLSLAFSGGHSPQLSSKNVGNYGK